MKTQVESLMLDKNAKTGEEVMVSKGRNKEKTLLPGIFRLTPVPAGDLDLDLILRGHFVLAGAIGSGSSNWDRGDSRREHISLDS